MRDDKEFTSPADEEVGPRTCPDCGRDMGDRHVCPYCETDIRKRTSHKFLALLAVIVLVFGLGYYVRATGMGRHYVEIGDINPDLNYGFAWVSGTVSGGLTYREHPSKRLEFDVYDGTGEISIRAYSAEAENIVNSGKFPGVGDEVEVFGMIRIEDYGRRIDLQSPEKFEITRTTPQQSTVSDVRSKFFSGQKYQKVTLEGILTDMRSFGWMTTYVIRDPNTGEPLDVFASAGLKEIGPDPPEDLNLYSRVEITGGVSEYQNSPQLVIRSYEDFKVVGRAELPEVVPLSEVGEHAAELIGAEGTIVFSMDDSGGYRFWLDNFEDNCDPVPLWIWDSTYKLISDNLKEQLQRGAVVKVYGDSTKYQGENQIELASPPEVSVVGTSSYEIKSVDVDEVSLDNVGDFVNLSGTVEQLGSQGRRFTLKGETGELRVSVPLEVHALMITPINQGDTVSVTGRLEQIDGELTLTPGLPGDIEVIS